MSGSWLVGGLTPAAVESYARLTVALARLADDGRLTPCQGPHAALWTSDDLEDREAASHRCTACPVLALCDAQGKHERHNAWGAHDRSPRPKRTKEKPCHIPTRRTTNERNDA